MNAAIQFVLTGAQGGGYRIRMLKALDERPQNISHLTETLALSQTTAKHHLDILVENGVIEKRSADPQAPYQITPQTRADWDTVKEYFEQVAEPSTSVLGIFVG